MTNVTTVSPNEGLNSILALPATLLTKTASGIQITSKNGIHDHSMLLSSLIMSEQADFTFFIALM